MISNDQCALNVLQSKGRLYFIERLIETSEDNISFLNLSGFSTNQNEIDEIKIFSNSINNLTICKEYYANVCANVGKNFHKYLRNIPEYFLQNIKDNLILNLYSFIDLKDEYNTKEVMNVFDRFFCTFGRFPAMQGFATVPTGEVPDFVNASKILSPSNLCKNFSSGNTGGLVCAQLLAALNVHLGGENEISNDAISVFFHKLSMQVLSRINKNILLKFDAINKLNKSINNLLQSEFLFFDKKK